MAAAAASSGEPQKFLMTVRLKECKDLLAADRGGTSDPYAVMCEVGKHEVGKYDERTSVHKKTLNPEFDHRFPPKAVRAGEAVVIRLFDKDTLTKDDPLGDITLRPEDFKTGYNFDVEVPVKGGTPKATGMAVLTVELEVRSRGPRLMGHWGELVAKTDAERPAEPAACALAVSDFFHKKLSHVLNRLDKKGEDDAAKARYAATSRENAKGFEDGVRDVIAKGLEEGSAGLDAAKRAEFVQDICDLADKFLDKVDCTDGHDDEPFGQTKLGPLAEWINAVKALDCYKAQDGDGVGITLVPTA